MTTDEELEQLRADTTILYEALVRKDNELDQAHAANMALREDTDSYDGGSPAKLTLLVNP